MLLFRVKYLSFFFILVSVFSFFNIIYSYYFNLYLNLNTYYVSLIISGLIGILFYYLKSSLKKPSIFEKILIVCFKISELLKDKKFVNDFFKLSS